MYYHCKGVFFCLLSPLRSLVIAIVSQSNTERLVMPPRQTLFECACSSAHQYLPRCKHTPSLRSGIESCHKVSGPPGSTFVYCPLKQQATRINLATHHLAASFLAKSRALQFNLQLLEWRHSGHSQALQLMNASLTDLFSSPPLPFVTQPPQLEVPNEPCVFPETGWRLGRHEFVRIFQSASTWKRY